MLKAFKSILAPFAFILITGTTTSAQTAAAEAPKTTEKALCIVANSYGLTVEELQSEEYGGPLAVLILPQEDEIRVYYNDLSGKKLYFELLLSQVEQAGDCPLNYENFSFAARSEPKKLRKITGEPVKQN